MDVGWKDGYPIWKCPDQTEYIIRKSGIQNCSYWSRHIYSRRDIEKWACMPSPGQATNQTCSMRRKLVWLDTIAWCCTNGTHRLRQKLRSMARAGCASKRILIQWTIWYSMSLRSMSTNIRRLWKCWDAQILPDYQERWRSGTPLLSIGCGM